MNRKILILSLLVILMAFSCSRSVEGETSAWNRNQQKVKDLIALYPSMRNPLDEKLKEATTAWDAAQSASGDEAKIAAMAKANGLLSSGLVRDLDNYGKLQKDIKALVIEVQAAAKDNQDNRTVFVARDQANQSLANAERRIQGGAQSAQEATVIVRDLTEDLEAAQKNLQKVNDSFKKQATDDKKAQTAEKEAEKAAVADWTCSYCAKSNSADAKECGGCGAAHEKK